MILSRNTTGSGFLITCNNEYANKFTRTSLYSKTEPGSSSLRFFQSSIVPCRGGRSAQSQTSNKQPDQSEDCVSKCRHVIFELCGPSNFPSHTYSLRRSSIFLIAWSSNASPATVDK